MHRMHQVDSGGALVGRPFRASGGAGQTPAQRALRVEWTYPLSWNQAEGVVVAVLELGVDDGVGAAGSMADVVADGLRRPEAKRGGNVAARRGRPPPRGGPRNGG